MALDPRDLVRTGEQRVVPLAPLAGSRTESMQRLQIGLFGLGMMILLVGLANIIMDSAQETRNTVAADVAPETPLEKAGSPASDPLADAGVVPDLPIEKKNAAGVAADQGAAGVPGAVQGPAQPAVIPAQDD